MTYPIIENWVEIVKDVESFHLKYASTISKTATKFDRSAGWTSETLQLARLIRIYPEAAELKSRKLAIQLMKEKKKRRKF